MTIPHTFPSLLDSENSVASVLIAGAGMSFDIAPNVKELADDILARHDEIVRVLGVDPSPPPGCPDDLYNWAQRAFDSLTAMLGLSPGDAKRRLADAMGITRDLRYQTNVETLGVRKSWARHRVVARFAREGRWKAVWSLNWDCVLETAFESIGLKPHPDPAANPPSDLPWNEWYFCWSPGDRVGPVAHNATLYLCKPHGCVRKLRNANPLFIVTRGELDDLTKQLEPASSQMQVGLSHTRLVTVGWKADERYICDNIDQLSVSGKLLNAEVDRLSIVNRTWYPVPPSSASTNHQKIAAAFGIDHAGCFFEVGSGARPTLDEFFLWAQTRYYLQTLVNISGGDRWLASKKAILEIQTHFNEPRPEHVVNDFVDEFVSVWVRLCFNTGRVRFMRRSAPVRRVLVPTHRRDEHIPWTYDQTERTDLWATIPLLLRIWNRQSQPGSTTWGFKDFPGGLWDAAERHLVLPLPAWGNTEAPLDLAGLKPLIDGRSWERKGEIRKFSVLPLGADPESAAYLDPNFAMRSSVALLMKHAPLADPSRLSVLSLANM